MATFVGFCQTIADSASIKNEEAQKRVLNNLKAQHILYSSEQEFDFINYLNPEKIDYSIKLIYKETQEEKAVRKWNEYKNKPPVYPTNRKEKYPFDY